MPADTLAGLIERRLCELGLTRAELAARLGYRNIAKGLRRIDEAGVGRLPVHSDLLARLPEALSLPEPEVREAWEGSRRKLQEAEAQAERRKEEIWRSTFEPHAVVLTERTYPELGQITICALAGGAKFLRIDLDPARPRATFIHQALRELNLRLMRSNGEVPFYGKPRGVVVNFHPDRAVRYDLDGRAVEVLPAAYRPEQPTALLGSRAIPITL